MNFAREPYSLGLITDMIPLWHRHQQESAAYPDIKLNPNLTIYQNSDVAGTLRVFTARHAGKLVGYQVFFVVKHPHSQQSLQANQDIVYMEPEVRRGLNGYRFIKWCSDQLLAEGCEVVYQHINAKRSLGRLLERMGYELVDLVYGRKKEGLCQPLSQ
jgi:hypothetical protein